MQIQRKFAVVDGNGDRVDTEAYSTHNEAIKMAAKADGLYVKEVTSKADTIAIWEHRVTKAMQYSEKSLAELMKLTKLPEWAYDVRFWHNLREQKSWLAGMVSSVRVSEEEDDRISGLLATIDAIQDLAVDDWGVEEGWVFQTEEKPDSVELFDNLEGIALDMLENLGYARPVLIHREDVKSFADEDGLEYSEHDITDIMDRISSDQCGPGELVMEAAKSATLAHLSED